ncbi:MAG: metal ABC transporter solute-binding protein, Zn/Mn family [bacterium]
MRYRLPAPLIGGLSLFGLALTLAACGGGTPSTTAAGDPRPARDKPLVVATTPMVGDLVREIGGDRIDLVVLIAPGTDPHLWTPTRTEVMKVLEADAVFMNGLMLEGRAGDAFARVELSGRPVVRVAEKLPKSDLLTDQQNSSHFDPHVWMDPVLWAKTAPAVRDALAKIDPDGKESYDRNLTAFETAAAALDRDCSLAINTIPVAQRTLVTAHDAFGYFGRRYGLAVRGIQGLSTESEPSLGDIEELVGKISEERIPAIFIETTVSDRTVRAVVDGCAAKGHELKIGEALYSDSLGRAGSAEGTWAGMMRHNAKSIANALGGRG